MNYRKIFSAAVVALFASQAIAQENKWFQNVKFSGYGMVQYQASDQEGKEKNSFDLRLVRMALEGRAHEDFYWKAQMQINGNTFEEKKGIRLVDLFGEWQRYDFARVKAGQFKRPFTFENPMHPITQGFMSYSQPISKLSGFSDRTGETPSNGRDIGVQVQGDVINLGGHKLLHYQVGVFNGEGINVSDADNRKDVIGGIWFVPVTGLRVGAFGWTGTRAEVGRKNRYAYSADYQQNDWTARAEYVHSQGLGANVQDGDKADGFYALLIAPVVKNRLHVKGRYDLYRNEASWDVRKINYELGVDYLFTKNLQLNLEYARVNDHTRNYATGGVNKDTYNMVDLELDFRF